MHKNKGFTLIELLSIIVIMGVIIVLAGPSMTKQFKKEEQNNNEIVRKKIHNATKLYIAKYHASELLNGSSISITLSDLQNDGLINLYSNKKCFTINENNDEKEINDDTINVTVEEKDNKLSIKYNYNGVKIQTGTTTTNLQKCYGCGGDTNINCTFNE